MKSNYFQNVMNMNYIRKHNGRIEYGTAGFRTKYEFFHILIL